MGKVQKISRTNTNQRLSPSSLLRNLSALWVCGWVCINCCVISQQREEILVGLMILAVCTRFQCEAVVVLKHRR